MYRNWSFLIVFAFAAVPSLAFAQNSDYSSASYVSPFDQEEAESDGAVTYDSTCSAALDSCCDQTCCNCPTWSAQAGYLQMWRKGLGPIPVLVTPDGLPPGQTRPIFFANQFDFDGESGLELALARDNANGRGIGFRYFGIKDFTDTINQNLPFSLNPATNPTTGVFAGFRFDPWGLSYESSLQSFELLGRTSNEIGTFTYGFRYVDLDETLGVRDPTLAANDPYADWFTDNDLYGLQLGLDGDVINQSRFRLGYLVKSGIFINDANATARFSPGQTGTDSDSDAAFVLETGLSLDYSICKNLSLTTGYRFLFIDGVALAADHVPNTGDMLLDPIAITIDKSSVYYHGWNIGLLLKY